MPRSLALGLLFLAGTAGAMGQAIRINCGGWSQPFQSADGKVWSPDRYYDSGQVTYEPDVQTADQRLYGTSRSGLYSDFAYQIPVANGTWKLTLKFAEIRGMPVGSRVFDVAVNGKVWLSRFDIMAVAPFPAVVDRSTTVDVTGGAVRIEFRRVTRYGIVSAIELEPAAAPLPPLTVTPSATTLTENQTVQLTASGAPSVVWSLSGTSSPGTISASGLYTAPSSIPLTQNVVVTAANTANPSQTGTAKVVLKSTVRVGVTPATADVTSGNSAQFTAVVAGTSDSRVTWTASTGTVSASGLYTAPLVTTATTAIVTATSMADTSVSGSAQVRIVSVVPSSGTVFVESGGMVSLEAEAAETIVRLPHSWVLHNDDPAASGGAYLRAEPDNGVYYDTNYTTQAPEAIYRVRFSTPGVYYVWLRGNSPSVASDSVNVGLDGAAVTTGERLSQFPAGGGWAWSNMAMDNVYRITLNIASAGIHTIHVWMREDGFAMDKLVLAQSASYTPSGTGPSPSAVESSTVPVLRVTPTTLTLGVSGSTVTASQAVSVSNAGVGTLNWTASSNAGWLTVSPASGSGAASVQITANKTGLASGTFNGIVTFVASGASLSPQQVAVSFTVPSTTPPALSASPQTLSLAALAGGSAPASQQITIGNIGGGTLSWSATATPAWLSVSPATGQAPGALSVTASITGLAAGSYQGSVVVTAPGATGSPATIPVTLTVTADTSGGRQFFVSPTGSASGDGSAARPWDIGTAFLPHASIRPGDTIWLRGGRYGNGYTQFVCRLAGTAANPIIVRQYPGERAIIDGGIATYSPYTWYWGFEIMSSVTDRSQSRGVPEGLDTYTGSTGVRLINLVIHDTNQGIGFWRFAIDAEAHGNIIYYNGYRGDTRGHGHGIYTQNETGNKVVSDNIIFNQFGLGIQAYGSENAFLRNYQINGNVSFNNGTLWTPDNKVDNILVTVGSGSRNINLDSNYTYHTPAKDDGYSRLGWQWSGTEYDMVARNNYFMGGESALEVWKWNQVTFTGNVTYSKSLFNLILTSSTSSAYTWDRNTYYGSGLFRFNGQNQNWQGWKSVTKLDANSSYVPGRPTGVWTFVRPNKYEAGRGNIVIYNWDLLSAVNVDVSPVLTRGDSYIVRDPQNWFGPPIANGIYDGQPIRIPMTGLPVGAPVGVSAPAHTAPEFGAFVVMKQ